MKNILILGASGMLGSAVYNCFKKDGKYEVHGTFRKEYPFLDDSLYIFDAYEHRDDILRIVDETDYVINCIGVIKPFINKDIAQSIYINSVFPHELAEACNTMDVKLIHITTDCVFSGAVGYYTEDSIHDESDIYGRSKSFGEPVDNAMVLRTSIIGEELHKFASLISWLKSMNGQRISGYQNHLWNGISTKAYAKACEKIIDEDWYDTGIFHLHSDTDLTKYELLEMLCDKYGLDIVVDKRDGPSSVNRTLRTSMALNMHLMFPPLYDQL